MKLETKRLILRDIKKKDANDILNNLNNLKISKWLMVVPYPYTKKDANWWVNDCEKKQRKKKRDSYEFCIELKSEKKIIGGIGLSKINYYHGKAMVGYWIGEDYWKNGYGFEALDAILRFAFNKLKLGRIEAGVFVGNPSSGKLLEKFRAKKEGIRRKARRCKADGKMKSEIIYGLLKKEWKRK